MAVSRVVGIGLVAGVIAATGQAPLSAWPLTLAALVYIFHLFDSLSGPRAAGWLGWGFGAGYFASALLWIVEPFLVDVPRHGWMAPFALVFLSGGLALLFALPFWLAGRLKLGVLGLVALWSAAEMLRGVLFTGFPWAALGHVWIGSPVAQLAGLFGAHGLTVLLLLCAALPTILPRDWGTLAAVALVAVSWTFGLVQMTVPVPTETHVRLIQPNASQELKWRPDMIPVFFQRALDLTAAQDGPAPDLVIWPETSVSHEMAGDPVTRARMSQAAVGVPVIFGANVFTVDGAFNTLAVLDGSGEIAERYAKHHLVPFGEYIPFAPVLGSVGIRGLADVSVRGFSKGTGPSLLDIPGVGRALPLICYELIFPRNLRVPERAKLIVQITNDAWFGDLTGPYQHLAQARLRAIEQGLPVLRAANTGVSAIIGPQGRIMAQADLGQAARVDGRLPAALPPTLYSISGDLPVQLLVTLLLVLGVARRRALGG
ncbi:MAG: apolipoprotein N-acyltransferase [Pseudomonadota bacterium]